MATNIKEMDRNLYDTLRLFRGNLTDPEASQVWGLIQAYERFNLPAMPLQPHEQRLIETVLMDR